MGRCDSFVVETDVHFPTDINLLFDAVRKMIEIAAAISQGIGSTMWRQSDYNVKSFKKLYRTAQQLKHSTSKDEKKKTKRARQIMEAYKEYIEAAEKHIQKARLTMDMVPESDIIGAARAEELQTYVNYALWQIDLIRRRVLQDEKIRVRLFCIFKNFLDILLSFHSGSRNNHLMILNFLCLSADSEAVVAGTMPFSYRS